MSEWHGGKGSKSRPMSVSREEYDAAWDRIFNNNNPLKGTPPVPDTMWEHHCSMNGRHMVGTGEECSWCGGTEEDEN